MGRWGLKGRWKRFPKKTQTEILAKQIGPMDITVVKFQTNAAYLVYSMCTTHTMYVYNIVLKPVFKIINQSSVHAWRLDTQCSDSTKYTYTYIAISWIGK